MSSPATNPYDSPAIPASPQVKQWIDWLGIWSQFSIFSGKREHRIAVMIPHWPAQGRVVVDGKEVQRFSMFQLRRVIKLSIDAPEPLQVEIRMRAGLTWTSQAFVNGELQIDEIFPLIKVMAVIFWTSVILLVLLALLAWGLERWLATNAGTPSIWPWVSPP